MRLLISSSLLFILCSCLPAEQSELVFDSGKRTPQSLNMNYKQNAQFVDRKFVYQTLVEVFNIVPGTSMDSIIKTNIFKRIEFGGACDLYAQSDNGNSTAEFTDELCSNGMGVVQPALGNPMRFALTIKSCEDLISTAAHFSAVRGKIFSDNVWKTPDEASVTKAWELFIRLEAIDAPTMNALIDIRKVTTTNEEAWKGILLALCSSPTWQVL